MQKKLLLCVLLFTGLRSYCQQEYFLYIQEDSRQPFYAKLSNKLYSSSETGYLIIPKLADSTYKVTIGFPKNAFPEQVFTVSINKKDNGFQLKNFGDKGWGLFNLQTMSVTMNTPSTAQVSSDLTGEKKTDAFSKLLANVVNDTAILYTAVKPAPVERVAEKKPSDSKPLPENKDSAIVQAPAATAQPPAEEKKAFAANTPAQPTTVTNTKDSINARTAKPVDAQAAVVNNKSLPETAKLPAPEKPFISRMEELKNEDLYTAVYLEQYNLHTDTIRISIPLKEQPVVLEQPAEQKPQAPVKEPAAPSPQTTTKTDDASAQLNSKQPSKTIIQPVAVDSSAVKKPALVITNSDCVSVATDHDVDKLRVKLLSDEAVDDKYNTARKFFKSKCFTVKQIKALTELFPTDETKYRFFDTAYPFVYDTSNFYLLGDLITGDYYKTRFKAMIVK